MNALIVVDVQNDFTPAGAGKPEGALSVRDGHAVVPIINAVMPRFELVVATQDWHPPGHKSFASEHEGREAFEVIQWQGLEQVLWPDHCVQGSDGAALHPALDTAHIDKVLRKGTDPDIDSYSAFYDNGHAKATGLADYLRQWEARAVYVAGIATDVCVEFTVLDACELGFDTYVIADACRGVEMTAGDVDRAWARMREAGATLVHSAEVPVSAGGGRRG